jgi:hypothetical protein
MLTLSKDSALAALNTSASERECYMQALVSKHPEIIMNNDRSLLFISWGQAIGDGDVAGRCSVNYLFDIRGAVPVIVGLKLAVQEAAD